MCFTGTQLYLFTSILSVAAFMLPEQNWVVATEIIWSQSSKDIVFFLPFIGKVDDFYAKLCRKARWPGLVWWRWTFIYSISIEDVVSVRLPGFGPSSATNQLSCVTMASHLSFLICKTHISLVSTSEGCWEDDLSST